MHATESAIPDALRRERACPHSMPGDWVPPYPSYSARFDEARSAVGVLILGVQGPVDDSVRSRLQHRSQELMERTGRMQSVLFRDQAEFIDSAGLLNRMVVCYFDDSASAAVVSESIADGWLAEGQAEPALGFFAEQIWPTLDRVETLYSSDHVQGVAHVANSLSGEIQEHGYWGSARDRMPATQTDRLDSEGGQRDLLDEVVSVEGLHNVCLIRSGQDWSQTLGDERATYLEEVEPVLRRGMEFLTDDGSDIGCLGNRYARVLDESGVVMDQSYGMSWWRSLADLDRWARDHPTHQSIFGVALRYLAEHGGSGHLKLTHEVFVMDRAQAIFRYRNCHAGTGVLSAFEA